MNGLLSKCDFTALVFILRNSPNKYSEITIRKNGIRRIRNAFIQLSLEITSGRITPLTNDYSIYAQLKNHFDYLLRQELDEYLLKKGY